MGERRDTATSDWELQFPEDWPGGSEPPPPTRARAGAPPPPERRPAFGDRLGRRRLVLVGAVTALALALVLGVVSAVQGHRRAEQQAQLRWQAAPAAAIPEGDAQLLGAWSTEGLVIRIGEATATAYRMSDGTEQWRFTPPRGTRICAAGTDTVRNTGLLVTGPPAGPDGAGVCDRLTGVELSSGGQRWEVDVTPLLGGAPPAETVIPPVPVGDRTAGFLLGGRLLVRDVLTGNPIWDITPADNDRQTWAQDRVPPCLLTSAAGSGNGILITKLCPDPDRRSVAVAQMFDASFGVSLWNQELPVSAPRPDRLSLLALSGSPAVVVFNGQRDQQSRVLALDRRSGTQVMDLPLSPADLPQWPETGGRYSAVPPQVMSTGDTVTYSVALSGMEPSGCLTGALVTVDAVAGAAYRTATEDGCAVTLTRSSEDAVLGLETGGGEMAPRVVRFLPTTGDIEYGPDLARNPIPEAPAVGIVEAQDGRLAVLPDGQRDAGTGILLPAYAIGD